MPRTAPRRSPSLMEALLAGSPGRGEQGVGREETEGPAEERRAAPRRPPPELWEAARLGMGFSMFGSGG